MADNFFDEKDIVNKPIEDKSVEKKEELPPFFDESDILSEQEVYGMSAPTGALLGAGIGQAIKSTVEPVGKAIEPIYKGAKQLPFIGEFLGAAEYAEKGQSVVGKKARKKIIEESEDVVDVISDKLKKQQKTASNKMGKVLKLVDKKLDPTNLNQNLNQIQKSIKNIKMPTEQGQKTIDSLNDLLNEYKQVKSEYSVKAKGKVKTGIEEATEKLEAIKSKLIMDAEELGEAKTFGPTKINEQAKRVGALDIQSGKVISTPIKSGEFTPIDIQKTDTSFFKKMSVDDLKNLQKSTSEIIKTADPKTQAYSQAVKAEIKLKEIIADKIEQGLGQKGLDIYKTAGKEYATVEQAYEVFPELKKNEVGKIKTSDFLRKIEETSATGDVKRQLFDKFFEKIKGDPEELSKLNSEITQLSDRYNLSQLSTKFGLDSTSLRNLSVRAGDITGKVLKYPKIAAKKILKNLPLIGAAVGGYLTYDQAIAAGATPEEALALSSSEAVESAALGPLFAERTGPMIGSIQYKLENNIKLTDEEKKQLSDISKQQFKNVLESTPQKVNFNSLADSIMELGEDKAPLANQFRNLQMENDTRRKKAKAHFLMNTQAYKAAEKQLESNSFKKLDDILENEGLGEQDKTNDDVTISDNVSEVDSKKKVEDNIEPQSTIEISEDGINLPSLEKPSLLKESEEIDAVDRAASSPFMTKRVEDLTETKDIIKKAEGYSGKLSSLSGIKEGIEIIKDDSKVKIGNKYYKIVQGKNGLQLKDGDVLLKNKNLSNSKYGMYVDNLGYLTTGIGDLITNENELDKWELTEKKANEDFDKEYEKRENSLSKSLKIQTGKELNEFPENLQKYLMDSYFNLNFTTWEKLMKALKEGNYAEAAIQSLTSKGTGTSPSGWASQNERPYALANALVKEEMKKGDTEEQLRKYQVLLDEINRVKSITGRGK